MRVGDAQFGSPVTFVEQARQNATQRAGLIEETDAANTNGVIAQIGQTGDDVWRVEDKRGLRCRLAAGETCREESGMLARYSGRGQKAGEKGVMRGIGKAAGGMSLFPSRRRQQLRQVWRAPLNKHILSHVVTQGVQRHQQDIVCTNQIASVNHSAPAFNAATISAV